MRIKDDEHRGSHPIYRKIRRHWIWKDKPFSKGQAFIDLILRATYDYGEVNIQGKKIELHAGQLFISELNFMNDWDWSRDKIRRFLLSMEKDDMIIQRTIKLSRHPADPNAGKAVGKVITLLNFERLHRDAFKKQEKELKKNK